MDDSLINWRLNAFTFRTVIPMRGFIMKKFHFFDEFDKYKRLLILFRPPHTE